MGKGKGKSIMVSGGDGGNATDLPDCSRVRVLLCDTNSDSCRHVFQLLTQCSYQVALVTSRAQLFDTLRSEGPCMDIILAEIAILIANESSIMRYIKRDIRLKHVPVITASMESTAKIFRKSVFCFLQKFQFFTTTAVALAFPYAASVLVFQSFVPSSPFLAMIHARIHTLFDAAGFPSSSEFFAILNLKLSQTVAISFLALPFTLSFFLFSKGCVIQALGDQELSKRSVFSCLARTHSPLLLTQLCNSLLVLSANATCFILLLFAFNLADEFGFSSPRFELFLSVAGALICSIILANTFTICNLALVLSGREGIGGFTAILKACVLIKGRTGTALSLALPINMAMAAVEALFQYRIVRVYHQAKSGISSVALEGMFIAYMYAILLVLDTIVVCFFLRSCEGDCYIEQYRRLPSHVEIEEDNNAFRTVKIVEDLP
nr:Hornerin like [Ipomoea batatas]